MHHSPLLYQLSYPNQIKLTGCTSVNPLPEMDSDEQLTEDFADYFLNKIVKIRDDLDQYGKFVVESHDHIKLKCVRL